MSLDLWSHQFCLACDKQVESDGAAYCSESCRLTELEKISTSCSQASSPGFTPASYPWSTPARQPSPAKFNLSPAYDFSSARQDAMDEKTSTTTRALSPSSSRTSLCSLQSTATTPDVTNMSTKTREELRAYAVSFEHVRSQRRRSH